MVDAAAPPERNIITVLAVDMVGSTRHIAACDPDDAQTFLDHWFEHVRDAVEAAGGVIVHYAGDGGIAIFGWPSPFEDHAERACIAAWDIQQRPDRAPGPHGNPVLFRVGVHSGLVGLRKAAHNQFSRFDVAGATVHFAAKLQQTAPPGETLISAETARLCRSPLQLELHGSALTLESSGTVHRLKARPTEDNQNAVARRYRSPIVGRIEELDALRKRLPCWGGQSCSIAIIGEPGIGKSRLAAAAIAQALAPETRSCVFYGDAQKRTTPFAAARTLIADLVNPRSALPDDSLLLAFGALQIDSRDRKALETLFMATKRPSPERSLHRTQKQIAHALVNAFSALALKQPTLLLIEDLQLIDFESRLFLQLLARAVTPQPLCLLLTSRPESLHEAREIAETIIQLQPLSRAQMEDLGRQLWPGGEPPMPLLNGAIDRADGVPFLLEEFLRAADATSPLGLQQLPQSVASVIHARLQRLSPQAKTFAQTLSLLGKEVELDFATAVLDADIGDLLNALFELERFAFVHPLTGQCTRFRHQIIAEACADTIPRARRQRIHRAAIRVITLRYASLSGRYEQLAFHAEEAGETEIALDYLWKAGLEARRNSAASSLSLIFHHAIELIERIGEAAEEKYVDIVLMCFASMLQLGEFRKMNVHLERTMELARGQGRATQLCSALSQLGMICWFEGRYTEGLRVTSEGLAMARSLQSPALVFSNQLMMANVLHGMGRLPHAISALEELCDMLTGELEHARLGAPALPRSMVLAFMGWFMKSTGRYTEGLDFARRALEIAVREQDTYAEVLARTSMGRHLLLLERNREAVECLSAARGLTDRNGYDAIKANLAGLMAIALTRTGAARQAIGLVEACFDDELPSRTGRVEVCYLHTGYAEALARCGEIERGLSALDQALVIARSIENPWLIVDCLGLRARLLGESAPDDPRISRDLGEQQSICRQFGLVAWTMAAAAPAGLPAPGDIDSRQSAPS